MDLIIEIALTLVLIMPSILTICFGVVQMRENRAMHRTVLKYLQNQNEKED